MAGSEQPDVPIWAEAKAKQHVDILKEVARSLDASESVRAKSPLGGMSEPALEAEQFRLAEMLEEGTITIDAFKRLREIDFFLHEMRQRRGFHPANREWKPESLSE